MQNSNLWQGALNGIFSAATTRALDTWKILQGHRWLDFFSSNMEEAQDFLDGVDISIKEAKSLGWIKQKVLVGSKSMRCEALYRHRNDPHHRNDPGHRNDPQ